MCSANSLQTSEEALRFPPDPDLPIYQKAIWRLTERALFRRKTDRSFEANQFFSRCIPAVHWNFDYPPYILVYLLVFPVFLAGAAGVLVGHPFDTVKVGVRQLLFVISVSLGNNRIS